jgi:hypothetical protein
VAIGSRKAPPEIIAALREIDPDADLIHVAKSEWLLGVRRGNPAARERLDEHLKELTPMVAAGKGLAYNSDEADRAATAQRLAKELELLQFFVRPPGFRPIDLFECEGRNPGWDIVRDFRERHWNYMNDLSGTIARKKVEMSFEDQNSWRDDVLIDYVEGEGEMLHKYVLNHTPSCTVPALPWADDSL